MGYQCLLFASSEASVGDFNFSSRTKLDAQFRQGLLCAACGIEDPAFIHHHIIPQQSGDPANASHGILSTLDNCVAICENCHWVVHQGARWRNGGVAPPSHFKFSHGPRTRGRGVRGDWLLRMEKAFDRIIGSVSRLT
ncbi:HNH endonuclease [Rhizobium sp. N324]|uniref:HNH endonuclease n=1 Tax=Rhizobium sp. N324 TaxID=1703969 RepID=UPI0009ECF67C